MLIAQTKMPGPVFVCVAVCTESGYATVSRSVHTHTHTPCVYDYRDILIRNNKLWSLVLGWFHMFPLREGGGKIKSQGMHIVRQEEAERQWRFDGV